MAIIDSPNALQTPPSFWNTVLRYGGISAIAGVVMSLLFYLLDFNMMSFSGMAIQFIVAFGISVTIAALAIKYQRDNFDGGYIGYGRALLIGLLVILVGSLGSSVWNYILINFIDPGYVDNLKDKFIETWGENMPAENLEEALEGFDKAGDILTILKNGIIGGLVVGLITGLIAAGIMKRDRPVL
jgi:hypothetical protein